MMMFSVMLSHVISQGFVLQSADWPVCKSVCVYFAVCPKALTHKPKQTGVECTLGWRQDPHAQTYSTLLQWCFISQHKPLTGHLGGDFWQGFY